ncbi:MAG: methyltransferase domain-containing protein [Coriobacteriia bacterium]|nr:methyltransferase domain-containing protein [Coriobacteriia bacterium]
MSERDTMLAGRLYDASDPELVSSPSATPAENRADAWPLACPVCDRRLSWGERTVSCSEGHSFDVAREGYVNLLPSQHRSRGMEGDVIGMLQARRRFLEAGHYRPLRDELSAQVGAVLQERAEGSGLVAGAPRAPVPCVLEVGCGEGYYVGGVADALSSYGGEPVVWLGSDLSKPAVKLAAKRYPKLTFFVADINRRLYVHDGSVSVLLDVFAPRNPTEFARVLEPGGSAVIVIPGESHLASLREQLGLLGIQENKEQLVIERLGDEFELVGRTEVGYPMELSAEAVADLVAMGPSSWHRPADEAQTIGKVAQTDAAFLVLRLQRK